MALVVCSHVTTIWLDRSPVAAVTPVTLTTSTLCSACDESPLEVVPSMSTLAVTSTW